jgi:hypothetical protein
MDDTVDESDFWSWVGVEEASIDLEKIFPKTGGMTSKVLGYLGTDSMPGKGTSPDCQSEFCWYMALPYGTIKSTTLAQLKQDGVEWNNRAVDQGAAAIYQYSFSGLLYTAPAANQEL